MSPAPATPNTVYEPVPMWAKIPHGVWLREATSVGVDADDNIYVFNRGNMAMVIMDREGNVIDTWGNDDPYSGTSMIEDPYGNMMLAWPESRFIRPHAIFVDHEENLWLIDDVGNKITKTDKQGNELMVIGTGIPTEKQDGEPFNRPTDAVVNPANGDIFISDGYGNSRIHRYDKDGNHILSWGEPGSDHGQFSLPHNLAMFGVDKVIVCDRENHRVQVFTLDGEFVKAWHVHHVVAVFSGRGEDTNTYVTEQGPPPVQFGVRNLGHRVSIYNNEGELVTRFGRDLPGEHPDQFLWPHSICVDSRGDVYVAEVSYTEVGRRQDPPREMVSLRKWRRVSG